MPTASPAAIDDTSRYFEDLEVGQRFNTYGRTITEADLAMFCALAGYHTPLFIDETYARQTRFGGRIAPSSPTATFSTAATEGLIRTSIVAHVGNNNARFLQPVRPGDTIRTQVEVIVKQDKPKSYGLVVFRDTVTNQRGTVVYTVEKTTLIKKRIMAGSEADESRR